MIFKEPEDIKTLLQKYSITYVQMDDKRWYWIRVMVFNVTINNISVISWLSVLFVLKSGDDYLFLFMWYDGIVPILYSVELILYM